ncbi:MAG TPA: aminodeoxychorismate/anthranilate synthase component II [Prolixibacteraceae bacterium]|nr:aminodeoxychorismate/anthranilate synthase component II [Prolixibacteraceae bacterium]
MDLPIIRTTMTTMTTTTTTTTTTTKILVLDNYDSFTYNLVHILKELTHREAVEVFRNDRISLDEVDRFDKIVLSPGPGIPDEAGILKSLIARYGASKSILGVCLGCQAIAEVYGGRLINLDRVYHGVATPVTLLDPNDRTFRGLNGSIEAGRYHSWVVDPSCVPPELVVSASDTEGHIMALYHKTYDVRGVQFHPESVLTPDGKQMIKNFLNF